MVFFSLAVVIPLLFHTFSTVLFYYAVTAIVIGVAMALIFVLPHLVGEAKFPLPVPGTNRIESPWAVHHIETTLDFARESRIWTWLLGGLNFHMGAPPRALSRLSVRRRRLHHIFFVMNLEYSPSQYATR